MVLKNLKIANFRNYDNLEISFSDGINIIYGDNAQGKTNILESIYVLGLTKSHRSLIDEDLIKEGKHISKIMGNIKNNDFISSFEILFEKKKKKYKIDNSIVKKTSDYMSNINIIIFYPEDLDLIKGSPSIRRKFLNLELSQLYNNYYIVLNDYNRLLKIRNDCLKKMNSNSKIDMTYFNIITNYLIEKAVFIYKARNKFIEKINFHARSIYDELMQRDSFEIKYCPSIDFESFSEEHMKQVLKGQLEKSFSSDIKMGNTLIGPHRDDFLFILENKDLKLYGSQGQQRIAVIAVKLAEIKIFKKYCDTTPILLLDDVFSELDDKKKNNLLKYIGDDVQTIITTTNLENIDQKIIKKSRIFKIESGNIVDIKG